MRRAANYEIVKADAESIILRDVGPHDMFLTITNAAEEVVAQLVRHGILRPHRQRLYYYDSEGELCELIIKNGRFAGFN